MENITVYKKNNTQLTTTGVAFHWWDAGVTSFHDHDYYEIFLVTSGSVIHNLNNEKKVIKERTLLLLRPEDKHQFLPYADNRCIHINIAATEEVLLQLSSALELDYSKIINGKRQIVLSEEDFSWFKFRAREINYLYEKDKNNVPLVIRQMLMRALALLEINKEDEDLSDTPPWMKSLLLRLHSPEYISLSANQIYNITGYSAPVVINAFKKYLNTTVIDYMKMIRTDFAKRLLSTTNLSILDISYKLGYTSLSHFSKLFKEQVGISPSEYRENVKKPPR